MAVSIRACSSVTMPLNHVHMQVQQHKRTVQFTMFDVIAFPGPRKKRRGSSEKEAIP